MKITPDKLAPHQNAYLEKLAPKLSRQLTLPTMRPVYRQNSSQQPGQVSRTAPTDSFEMNARVEFLRDVPDTLYRAGQRGTIVALHGMPPRVAEVEVDRTFYADVVSIADLKALR